MVEGPPLHRVPHRRVLRHVHDDRRRGHPHLHAHRRAHPGSARRSRRDRRDPHDARHLRHQQPRARGAPAACVPRPAHALRREAGHHLVGRRQVPLGVVPQARAGHRPGLRGLLGGALPARARRGQRRRHGHPHARLRAAYDPVPGGVRGVRGARRLPAGGRLLGVIAAVVVCHRHCRLGDTVLPRTRRRRLVAHRLLLLLRRHHVGHRQVHGWPRERRAHPRLEQRHAVHPLRADGPAQRGHRPLRRCWRADHAHPRRVPRGRRSVCHLAREEGRH